MPLLTDIARQYPPPDKRDYRQLNQKLFQMQDKTCVVIDDDPTGNQTVYDIPLVTDWSVATIKTAFENKTPMFFILTNSRSMTAEMAKSVYATIARNIKTAHQETGRNFVIISRSDSTLRGHYQAELSALNEVLETPGIITFFIPVMFEGGRVTVDAVHYIKDEDQLIPVGETAFANDASFGYSASNLKAWVEEKTQGDILADSVTTFSLNAIRNQNTAQLATKVFELASGTTAVCDALEYSDLDKMLHAILLAEGKGKKIRFRTSSSFLPSYIGQTPKPLLGATDLNLKDESGGLIVVGSYVKKSSQQLAYLLQKSTEEEVYELDVEEVVNGMSAASYEAISKAIDSMLLRQQKVILYTSRKLIVGGSAAENLEIGNKISNALVAIVSQLKTKPRYILAKGGITSHDLAVKALNMKRGFVIGQLIPGVPIWRINGESAFAGIPYIVFPGNVGQEASIFEITEKLK